MLIAVARKKKTTSPARKALEDDKSLSLVAYHNQIKNGALHVHVGPGDKHYILRADSLSFSPRSVLLTSTSGMECCFTKRWVTAINPKC